jgi:hypothetical protein
MKKTGGSMTEHTKKDTGGKDPHNSLKTGEGERTRHHQWNFVMLTAAVVFVFIICTSLVAVADGDPILPNRFYGTVVINNVSAPAGTFIEAVVSGGGGNFSVTQTGIYGSNELTGTKFIVQGIINEGEPISFFVNGIAAEVYPVATSGPWQATYPFHSDANINLNIRASGVMYTIAASAGDGGTINPAGDVDVLEGEDQAFSITPNDCYMISEVYVDGEPVGAVSTYTFYDVDDDHTIEAQFEPITYTVTTVAGEGGSVSPEGPITIPCGGNQNLTVIPDPCWEIADVLVNGESVGPVEVVQIVNAHMNYTVCASFTQITYTITTDAGEGGSICPEGPLTIPCGGSQNLTVIPDPCWEIADVLVNGESLGPVPVVQIVDADRDYTVCASFTQITYTIATEAGEGGSICPEGPLTIPCGGNQNLTVIPDTCWKIDDVLVNGESLGPVPVVQIVNADRNYTVTATFLPVTYTIDTIHFIGGTISPQGPITIPCGGSQNISIIPDPCWKILEVELNGESLGPVSEVQIVNADRNYTVFAVFWPSQYQIMATAGDGGSICPAGEINVSCGGTRSFIIYPDSGYHIEDVFVDGNSTGPVTSYAFTNVHENHTIHATFAEGGPVYFDEILYSGWNLFSTPILLEPGYENLEDIFQPAELDKIEMILAWDGSHWYIPGEGFELDPLYCVYVKVASDEAATAHIYPSQSVSAPPARALSSGLSLIGSAPAYDSGIFPAMRVDLALKSIEQAPGNLTGYTMVISPSLNQPSWVYVPGATLHDVLPFKGYWVVMENPDVLYGFSTTPIY